MNKLNMSLTLSGCMSNTFQAQQTCVEMLVVNILNVKYIYMHGSNGYQISLFVKMLIHILWVLLPTKCDVQTDLDNYEFIKIKMLSQFENWWVGLDVSLSILI